MQSHVFLEISKKVDDVKAILDEEEQSFARTLDRGERLFDQYVAKARKAGSKELSGKDVWRLYDTYGFPVDLTRLMAEELGFAINETEFEEAQRHSKEASKGGAKDEGKVAVKLDVHDLAVLEQNNNVPKTDDSTKYCESG
jgi:alanyl-tRNA synthetase